MSKRTAEVEATIPGFTKLTDQVYVHEGGALSQRDPKHPSTIIIYGWGDARPRHVVKYVDGYRQLFPHARVVLVFSPILRALYQTLEARSRNMIPVVQAAYPHLFGDDSNGDQQSHDPDRRMLLHVMSNTGGINCAATMHAYAQHTGGDILPHALLACDSTPGSTHFLPNVGPWSRAMALGAARWFPWPFAVTQALAALFLACLHGLGWLVGTTSAAEFSTAAVNDRTMSDLAAKRLYLYSKEDDIIRWEDIEQHAADARRKGWSVSAELFAGTPHVGHMRGHPEQYWAAIAAAWREASQ